MVSPVKIAGRVIGPGERCFIIAEAGVNHNGNIEMAHGLIDVAVEAGADAVKFQTFRASQVISPRAPKAAYQMRTTRADESQLEMVRKLELPFVVFRELSERCREHGIIFLSTPFDEESVDFLAGLDVPAIKVPSGELTNLPLLRRIGQKGTPLILSTGMSYLEEVERAVRTVREEGCADLVLLHCTSSYPADPGECNLRAMETLCTTFAVPVGYSDHTPGIEIACAAVALGACVIEKHFTLDRSLPGPDHGASLDPAQLRDLVRAIRSVETAIGDGIKRPMPGELEVRSVARRSLVAARNLAAGDVLTPHDVAARRPGTGISPIELERVVGRRTTVAIQAEELLHWDQLA